MEQTATSPVQRGVEGLGLLGGTAWMYLVNPASRDHPRLGFKVPNHGALSRRP